MLQGIDHVALMAPVCRLARTLRVAEQITRDLDKAWAMAQGDGNPPGPVYLEIPTDVLRQKVPDACVLAEHLSAQRRRPVEPLAADITAAAALVRAARRPLVVTGRGARGSSAELLALLDASGAVYLDTQESRALVPADHASVVSALRARAMAEADLMLVVGRQLDYQMAYGSPAVFKNARFVRIADHADELRDNRRGEAEILADAGLAMAALARALGMPSPALDCAWTEELRAKHLERSRKYADGLVRAEPGKDGHMHPNQIFGALRGELAPDAITVADGGDLLSFARMGLEPRDYLDAGSFGCLGVGTPYGVAAALLYPERQVLVVTGDGAFGINAMEIDSAKRHGAKVVFIVSNNAAWNIERLDQEINYGGRVIGTTLAWSDYAAMARVFGLHAERVTDPARLKGAIEAAFAKAPALLDVVTTQYALSSDAGKGLGWVPARQALTAWDDAEKARRGETG
ncbi:MAG: thiamine pyrophosphate-binding protein [Rhodocyclaceae bacterium]|nr:thiamine pyrophosphate-binding protein [Rhodocyclaceae bacterium]MBX3667248.1 thiamine pyrophosphate-binding protein [Rhodocyclaceae bacterium]